MKTLVKTGYWLLAGLLGLSFLAAGWPKILPNENMVIRFENWGYTVEFAVLVGVLEMAGGLLVLIPRLAIYGAILIGMIMLGAIYTHLSTGIGSPLFAFVYLAMSIGLGFIRLNMMK